MKRIKYYIKNTRLEINRFWNFLSRADKIKVIIYCSWILITGILFLTGLDISTIESRLLSVIISVGISLSPLGGILNLISDYSKNRDKIKLQDFYMDNIMNIYNFNLKKLIENMPDITIGSIEKGKMSSLDAMKLRSGLKSIKKNIGLIEQDKDLLTFKERRCLYILNARIKEFLEEQGIDDQKPGIVYADHEIEIDWRTIMWVSDIPLLLSGEHAYNDSNVEKMHKKREFSKYE